MDISEYDAFIGSLCIGALSANVAPQDLLDQRLTQGDRDSVEGVQLREQLIAGSEADSVLPLLTSGYFKSLSARQRVAAFLVTLEVATRMEQTRLRQRLEAYDPSQPLFKLSAPLYRSVRDRELIDVASIREFRDDGSVQMANGWGRLDSMLPPELVQQVLASYPKAPLWVRLDPDVAHASKRPNALMEAILVPASPKWWKNLGLFRGASTGAKYVILSPQSAADDMESFVEYHVKGLRKLETIAQRKKADHLTCMLEELQLTREGVLIGRCIHLDTNAERGTPPDEASVMHLDLAINVYVDGKVKDRMESQLNDAEKEDASFRSHILRVESVPFGVLPAFCAAFFQSHVLLRDLISNQFSTK